jgi:hypothetical protein
MPPISIVSSTTSNFAFAGGEFVPEEFKFPANTLIPYYGNTPVLSDWERYSAADGKFIYSTVAPTQVGVALAAVSGGGSISATTTTAGAHSGPTFTQNIINTTGGSSAFQNGSGGSHNHSVSGSSAGASTPSMLNRQNITFLRAVRSVVRLPQNALVAKQTSPANSTAFTRTGNNYLVGALDSQTFTAGTPFSSSGSVSTNTAGSHWHVGSSTAYRPYAAGAYLRNFNVQFGGSHSHTGSITFSQSAILSKLLNLWQMVIGGRPETDMIVMYVGTISSIPAPWYLCNGNNGTLNLGSYVIGYSDNQWNILVNANNTGTATINSAYVPHYHSSGYASTANVSGPSAQHNNYGWSHTHSSMSASGTAYVPPRIGVAFIQYKGIIP